jgi:hypothetical protein
MPARADAVVMIAAHLGAVAVEVHADRATPGAAWAGTAMAVRREVGGLDGRGGHRRSSTTGRAIAWRFDRSIARRRAQRLKIARAHALRGSIPLLGIMIPLS